MSIKLDEIEQLAREYPARAASNGGANGKDVAILCGVILGLTAEIRTRPALSADEVRDLKWAAAELRDQYASGSVPERHWVRNCKRVCDTLDRLTREGK